MCVLDGVEDFVPVGSPKVGGSAESSYGVLVGLSVVDHDVLGIIGLHFESEVGVDLDYTLPILSLDGEKKRAEPFEGAEITADPEKVYLADTGGALGVVLAVPDAFEDGGEGGDTDTGTNEDGGFELEDILRGGSEWAIDVDTGKDAAEGWVHFVGSLLTDTNNL